MKKKHLIIKKIWSGFTAMLLLASMLGSGALAAGKILTDRVEHTDKKFEEFEYYRMEEKDFDEIVRELPVLTVDAANTEQVMDMITRMEDYSVEMSGNYTLAHINTTLDASNEAYDEELKFYDELAVSVGDKIMQNYKLVATSPCGEALKERIDDEDDWQDILDYEPLTEEQKELNKKETELSLKYDELYNDDYNVSIGNKEYDEDALSEAYDAGEIDFEDYLYGLGDILTQRNQVMGELYLQLVDVRTRLAKTYGYDNYADYAYDKIYDRDYTPEELEDYRKQIIEYMAPLEDELYELIQGEYSDELSRMQQTKVTDQECLEKLGRFLPEISDDMLVPYHYMIDHNLCDLSVNDAKAPGGYTTSIEGYNAPYMFNCASGDYSDMQTLIHEFGHYNQMYYASEDTWYYGTSDLDLAEINSQGLEVLFMEYSDDIYGEYGQLMNLYGAFNQVYACISGCKEDAFQYAVYSDPDNLTLEKLNHLYYEISEEYDDYDLYNTYYLGLYGVIDTDSIYEWVEIPHTFQSPMYYISYSVSMSAVEELRDIILNDREAGIETYLKLAEAGPDNAFQETLELNGVNNPIKDPRFETYADNIRRMLGLADDASGSAVTDSFDDADSFGDINHPDDSFAGAEDDLDRQFGVNYVSPFLVAVLIVLAVILVGVIIVVILVIRNNKKREERPVSANAVAYVPDKVQAYGMNPPGPVNPQVCGMNPPGPVNPQAYVEKTEHAAEEDLGRKDSEEESHTVENVTRTAEIAEDTDVFQRNTENGIQNDGDGAIG